MVEIADMFRLHGPEYGATFGDRRLPRPLRALQALERCRTAMLGGQVSPWETCRASHDRDHAGTNRPCPTCQQDQAAPGLDHHKRLLRPVPHCMVTLTLPAERRALGRRHQQTLDNIRVRRSSEAVQERALDPRFIGGRIGMVGGLQTWTRDRRYPPPVHDLVAGGGLSAEGAWRPSRQDCRVHVKPLSGLCRAQCRAQLHQTDLVPLVDAHVWNTDGVVHCEPVGSGEEACRELAPYIFRVAISHHRIGKRDEGHVTFQHKASATDQTQSSTVPAEEGIRRFLQQVRPDRCSNGRYDGFLSPGHRHWLTRVRA